MRPAATRLLRHRVAVVSETGYWLNNGSSDHSLTGVSTWQGITYTYTLDHSGFNYSTRAGQVTLTISCPGGLMKAEWEQSGRYGTTAFTPVGGGTLTLLGSALPGNGFPIYIWMISSDNTNLDRWQFS